MNCQEIVKNYLKDNGYDGLCHVETEFRVNFTISEHSKMVLAKLAMDKKISKSELVKNLIIEYFIEHFDEKKEMILLENIIDKIDLSNISSMDMINFIL